MVSILPSTTTRRKGLSMKNMDSLKGEARRYVRSGHFPTYLNHMSMQEAKAFWMYVKQFDKEGV